MIRLGAHRPGPFEQQTRVRQRLRQPRDADEWPTGELRQGRLAHRLLVNGRGLQRQPGRGVIQHRAELASLAEDVRRTGLLIDDERPWLLLKRRAPVPEQPPEAEQRPNDHSDQDAGERRDVQPAQRLIRNVGLTSQQRQGRPLRHQPVGLEQVPAALHDSSPPPVN
jgi:hypothetical protein